MNLIMLLVALSFAGTPKNIAVKAKDADGQAYHAWLAQHPEFNSYLAYVENSMGSEQINKNTIDSFYAAKKSALNGKSREAKEGFLALTEMALESHWPLPQQEVIFHSFLYLAEIVDSPLEKKLWIKKAIAYSPWQEPNLKNYSPATRNLFASAKTKLKENLFVWRPYDRFSEFDFVLINGIQFDISPESEILLAKSQYRITFISHELLEQTKLLESDSLNSIVVTQQPLFDGSCELPKAHLEARADEAKNKFLVFFSSGCVRSYDGKSWSEYSDLIPKYKLPSPEGNALAMLNTNRDGQESHKKKSRWKWIGASVLAAAVGYAVYDHNRPTEVRKVIVEPED